MSNGRKCQGGSRSVQASGSRSFLWIGGISVFLFGWMSLLPSAMPLVCAQVATEPATAPAATTRASNRGPRGPINDPNMVVVYPELTNISSVPITNPEKGWALYSWGQVPREFGKGAVDSASILYLRPDWSAIEGEAEGKFDWTMIDDHIRAATAMGKKLGFRIMGLNPHSWTEYTFPKWVVEGHEDEFYKAQINLEGTLKDRWFPKDPNTSARWKYACKHLADELGKRYDKNPGVAFVEVGTIGDWGEQISNYAPTNQMLKQLPWREHLGWYKAAFPSKPLISVAAGQDRMEFAWQDENGFGRRIDGFCAPPVKEDTTDGAYQDGRLIGASFKSRCPSFLEFPSGTDFNGAGRNFWWGTFWNGIIELGKPTYLGSNFDGRMINGMYEKYPYRLIESGNRAGYHLVTERIIYSKNLLETGKGSVSVVFRNDGCRYPDYPIYMAVALLDAKNRVIQQVWCDSVNLQENSAPWIKYEMLDNLTGRFVLPVPTLYTGTAAVVLTPSDKAKHLAMGFFTSKSADTDKTAEPDVKLGIEGRLENGWYPLDQYATTPQTDLYPALHNLSLKKMVMVSGSAEGKTGALSDGNASTKWSSPQTLNQWASIDLGSIKTFSSIMLDWDTTFAKVYTVEASLNGANWTILSQTTNGTGGFNYISVPNTQARFVRVTGNDNQGLSLYDFEVLGSEQAERRGRRRQ